MVVVVVLYNRREMSRPEGNLSLNQQTYNNKKLDYNSIVFSSAQTRSIRHVFFALARVCYKSNLCSVLCIGLKALCGHLPCIRVCVLGCVLAIDDNCKGNGGKY